MKKFFSLSLAAFMLAAVFCAAFIAPLTVAAEEVRYEVFDLTTKDAAPEDTSTWYSDGIIIAVTNDGSAEKTIASGEYPMRYLFILIYDKDGVCVELGNNLLTADDEKAASFPQHDVKIPAGGFVILFYYNENEGPSNKVLFDYYNDLGGAALSNETGKVSSGKTYTAELEGNTVTVYFGVNGDNASSAPDASSEEPAETSSEDSAENSAEESSAVSADESSEASADESSEAEPSTSSEASESAAESSSASSESSAPAASSSTETSNADSSQGNDDGSNVPLIIGIVIAVVAVAAVVVIVIAKKK